MEITFTIPGAQVTVDRGADQSSRFSFRKSNTKQVETAGFDINIYTLSPMMIDGVLRVKYLTKSQADQLRQFFANNVSFVKSFTITPYSALDLGAGLGVTLTDVYLQEGITSTEEMIMPMGLGGKYELYLPYKSRALIGVGASGIAVI